MSFTDDDLKRLKDACREPGLGFFFETPGDIDALLARLDAAEKAVDECSCLTSHPAFTQGTRSYDALPQGMVARHESAIKAIDAWLRAKGERR